MNLKNKEEKSRLFFYLFYESHFWYIKTSNLADFKYVIIVARSILVMKMQFSNFGLNAIFGRF